jgi:hypothetical protein
MSLVLKKVPCPVPFAWIIEPATSVTNQYPCALRFFAMHEP